MTIYLVIKPNVLTVVKVEMKMSTPHKKSPVCFLMCSNGGQTAAQSKVSFGSLDDLKKLMNKKKGL